MATKRQRGKERPQPMRVPPWLGPDASPGTQGQSTGPQQVMKDGEAAATGGLKLRRLHIQNYKAIDDLVLEIPAPRMPSGSDILVLGSRNGVGKTSVLEAIGLAVFATYKSSTWDFKMPDPLMDIMVRAGEHEAMIDAKFEYSGATEELHIAIRREVNLIQFEGARFAAWHIGRFAAPPGKADIPFRALLGHESEPLLAPPLLYFHSYRKVVEGSVEIGEILASSTPTSREERRQASTESAYHATSAFKVEILRALMNRAGLFEGTAPASNGDELDELNKLMQRFAGGVIEKLRPSRDNSIDLRVSPTAGGPSYSFDGLSSGQKEIISTLFLIWKYTRNQPSIVLIDEPELHLNAEWHRSFVRALSELPADNQYILATHSEDVFASVDEDRRVLLSSPTPGAER